MKPAFLTVFFFALGLSAIATTPAPGILALQGPQTVSPGQVITLTWSATTTTIPGDMSVGPLEVAMTGDTFSGWLALANDVDPRAGTASLTVPDALSGTYTVALISPSEGKVAAQYGPFAIGDAAMHEMAEGTETLLPASRTARLSSVPASKSASHTSSESVSAKFSSLSAHQSSSHQSASSSKSAATTSARASATSSTTSQFQSSTSTVYASGYTGYPSKNASASAAAMMKQGCGFKFMAILASTLVTFACS